MDPKLYEINYSSEVPKIPNLTHLSPTATNSDILLQLNNCITMNSYLESHIHNLRELIIMQNKQTNYITITLSEQIKKLQEELALKSSQILEHTHGIHGFSVHDGCTLGVKR